jgi:hypothetical protein
MVISDSVPYTDTIGLKWVIQPKKIKGLPIFNFNIFVTRIMMYVEPENKWEQVFDVEEQRASIR